MPLRHVDKVEIIEAPRGIRHSCEAEVGAVGEHRREQRVFVGGRMAGAQMDESIRESGPRIDIAHHFGDPHPRQQPVQPQCQIACRLRHNRRDAGDEQFAILDLDTVDLAAPGAFGYERQTFAQHLRPGRDLTAGIGFAANSQIPRGFAGSR